MTPDAVVKAIHAYVAANWTSTPVQYDNLPFAQPAGPYISVSVLLGDVFDDEIGEDGLSHRIGVLKVRVFTKLGVGAQGGWNICGQVEALFKKKAVGDVYFDSPKSERIGDDGNNRYMHVVDCPLWCWT